MKYIYNQCVTLFLGLTCIAVWNAYAADASKMGLMGHTTMEQVSIPVREGSGSGCYKLASGVITTEANSNPPNMQQRNTGQCRDGFIPTSSQLGASPYESVYVSGGIGTPKYAIESLQTQITIYCCPLIKHWYPKNNPPKSN